MKVSGASTIFGLTSSKIMGQCNHIYPPSNNRPPFYAKMLPTTWQLCCKISVNRASMEHQRRVNDFWSCILDSPRAMKRSWSTINQSAARIGNDASDVIASTSYNWAPRERQQFCGSSASYTATNCMAVFLNWVLPGQSFQYVLVYNITNMHAMSHRSDLFACSSRVNI